MQQYACQNAEPFPAQAPKQPVSAGHGFRAVSRQLPLHAFAWHDEQADGREAVESFIRDRFAEVYSARLSTFMPCLLSIRHDADLTGAVGLRPAGEGRLFLEQYLRQPVEQAVAAVARAPVNRHQIVEIGNLAAQHLGVSQLLFLALGSLLQAAGCRWLVFSATGPVARMVDKVNLPTHVLCEADPSRLAGPVADWGSYYETAPQVMVGDIQTAFATMTRRPGLAAALALFGPVAEQLAAELLQRQGASAFQPAGGAA